MGFIEVMGVSRLRGRKHQMAEQVRPQHDWKERRPTTLLKNKNRS